MDVSAEFEQSKVHLNSFYYHFKNYIYQSLIKSSSGEALRSPPPHDVIVYQAMQMDATLYGMGISYDQKIEYSTHTYYVRAALNTLRGKLKNGENIPRMMPTNANLSLTQEIDHLKNSINLKLVDKARHLGTFEPDTSSYMMFDCQSSYHDHYKMYNYSLWIKAENLTNSYATNHLSYLKESAPYAGRQFKFGAEVSF